MAEPHAQQPRQRGAVAPGMLAAVATLVSLSSYTAVIRPGMWIAVVVVIVLVTAVTGMIGRAVLGRLRDGIRSFLTLILQAVALAISCAVMLASETAIAGLFPTGTTVQLIGVHLQRAVVEITEGVAPIASTLSIATAVGLAFAIVSVLVDQLLSARVIVLTVLFTSIVGVVPMLLSFSSVNLVWFVMQAVMILLILRFGARGDRPAQRRSSFLTASLGGALAITLTVIAVPALPLASALPGTGPMLTVSADLRLGDDLRRPEGVEALTLITSAASPPYLRLATLSRFNGDVWRADRDERTRLEDGFGERPWVEGVKTVENTVSIKVFGVSSDSLPVPYAAEKVTGVDSSWQAMLLNRTVLTRTADAAGADYTVKTATPSPTLEQIRASAAVGEDLVGAPATGLPPVIGELAREVTADATTDYDKLIALQNWFRTEFSYSLEAPVEDGFDGTGAEAVVKFLEERSGYCVHFAGAFALMAQSLDMPVRIVVGYLPGSDSGKKKGADTIWSVSSDQLHSWPEVFFSGIGWVPFEPTATLGTPTQFVAESATDDDPDAPDAPEPSASSSAAPSIAPSLEADDPQQAPNADSQLDRLNPTPVVLVVLGILLIALLPALLRRMRRMLRLRRAREGDAMAAWREIADTLVDLGWSVSEAETARVRAERLIRRQDVPADALQRVVDAVERQSYAAADSAQEDLSLALRAVLGALESGVDARIRLLALLLPASLFPVRRPRPA